jgi:hypothetical protein
VAYRGKHKESDVEKKKCFKCGEEKELGQFYKHDMMGDGHLGKCIDCTKLDVRNHRALNGDKIREYDRNRPNKKERAAISRSKADKKKHYVNAIARRALKSGRIIKRPCHFCGKPEVEMHHVDYDQPLLVYFLCTVCHKRHEAMVRATRIPDEAT